MSNENETLAQVAEDIAHIPWGVYTGKIETGDEGGISQAYCNELSARILAAHQREMAAKDAEIEALKNENARLRVINCGSIYAEGNLREEIERLRELVKGLADVADCLNRYPAKCCYEERPDCNGCEEHEHCRFYKHNALVAKARKVIGGAK